MLKAIQKNLEFLDNKQVVDTLYAVGRLHKGQKVKEMQQNHPEFQRYFTYFLKDMMKETKTRINDLAPVQIAYICKGLSDARKLFDEKNLMTESELRESIKQHAITYKDQYDPYSITKVLRYLFNQNDGSATSL